MEEKFLIYVYDVIPGKHKSPRRTMFNKELFGFKYKWTTRDGEKTRFRKGLIQLLGAKRIGDSVIGVKVEYEDKFDELFKNYKDVIKTRKFLIFKEKEIL